MVQPVGGLQVARQAAGNTSAPTMLSGGNPCTTWMVFMMPSPRPAGARGDPILPYLRHSRNGRYRRHSAPTTVLDRAGTDGYNWSFRGQCPPPRSS